MPKAHKKNLKYILPKVILLFAWLTLLIIGIKNHVFWRDEVRALSISQEADGICHLLDLLKNEGHPPLWYAILFWGNRIIDSNIILPIAATIFAVINAFLLLFRSPFHWSVIALILLGQYGLFEYTLLARNYGLAATFMLSFALTAQKEKNLFPYVFLCLAALSNFYALVFSCILGSFYLWHKSAFKKRILPFMLLMITAIFCIILMKPSAESLVVSNFKNIPWGKVWDVGWGFDNLFNGIIKFKHGTKTFILVLVTLIFWRKWKWMFCAYFGMLFMAAFHLMVRVNFSHHEGMFYFFLITLIWWKWDLVKLQFINRNVIPKIGFIAFLAILTFNLSRGIRTYELFYNLDQSNSDHLGYWLNKNTNTNDVIIGDPDYTMEAVVYYYPKPFYLPRESRFRKFALFTTANKQKLSLERLMLLTDSFKKKGRKTYLITQWDLDTLKDTTIKYSYGKEFTIKPKVQTKFEQEFKRDTHFHTFISTDESYFVYSRKE